MKLHSALALGPGDVRPAQGSFVDPPRRRGRPRRVYRLRVRGPEDVDTARRMGLAVYLLTSGRLRQLGVPVRLRPHLLLAQELDAVVDTEFPRIVFRWGETLRTPRIEELVVALLSVDPLSARLLALRNRAFLDPRRLAERVVQEGVAAPATRVGLQALAPGIPAVGSPWPRRALEQHDRGHTVVGVRA